MGVRRGAACVQRGRRIPLWLPLSATGPQVGAVPGRVNPLRTMITLNTPLEANSEITILPAVSGG